MSVPGILYNIGLGLIGSSLSDTRSSVKQGGEDFEQLLKSLQSSDPSAAQQAIAALQQVQAGVQGNAAAANPLSADLAALGAALDTDSLTGAKEAFARLQRDFQLLPKPGGEYGSVDYAAQMHAMLQQLGAGASSLASGVQAVGGRSGESNLLTQDTISRLLADLRAASMSGIKTSASIQALG